MTRAWIRFVVFGCTALTAASATWAQNSTYNSSVTLLGGLGGSIDESDAGLTNPTFQLGYSGVIDANTMVSLRVGTLDFGGDEPVGELYDSSLTYATIGGEYRTRQGFYSGALVESGVYIALGGYNLKGTSLQEIELPEVPELPEDPDGEEETEPEPMFMSVDEDETNLGLAVGVVGDWEISRRWIFRFELSGHYTLLEHASLFVMAHAGFGIRF